MDVRSALFLLAVACAAPEPPPPHRCGDAAGFEVFDDGRTSCAVLLHSVVFVQDWGMRQGVWSADQRWSGWTLRFVRSLPSAGRPLLGQTDRRSLQGPRVTISTELGWRQSLATLFHEALHVTEGKEGHCLWSTRYLKQFSAIEDLGAFYDECAGLWCAGDDEGHNWSCRPERPPE